MLVLSFSAFDPNPNSLCVAEPPPSGQHLLCISPSTSRCGHFGEARPSCVSYLPHRVIDVDLAIAKGTGYRVESGELSYDPLDRSELSGATRDVPDDPPPLKWSDLGYVFDIQEDCNGKEAIQA